MAGSEAHDEGDFDTMMELDGNENGEQQQPANQGQQQQPPEVINLISDPICLNSEPNMGGSQRVTQSQLHPPSEPPFYSTNLLADDPSAISYGGAETGDAHQDQTTFGSDEAAQHMAGTLGDDEAHLSIMQPGTEGQDYAEEATYPVEPAHESVQPTYEPDTPAETAAPMPKKKKKKGKKKKKVQQHDNDAPIMMTPLNGYQAPFDGPPMQEQMQEEQQYPPVYDDLQIQDQQQYAAPHHEQQYEQQFEQQQDSEMNENLQQYSQGQYPEPERLITPQPYADGNATSPHHQLNEDLQTAAWNANGVGVRTIAPAPLEERHESSRSVFQTKPSTYRPRRLLDTPATFQRSTSSSRARYDHINTSQTPRWNSQQQAAVEQPSSDIEGDFEQLFRKVHRKSSKKTTQLTAEKDSLQNELHQALSTKSSLEDQLSNLQQEKEALAASLEKSNTANAVCKQTAQRLQNFVNGIGNDMTALRKNAESYHAQSTTLFDEGKAQISKHAEESKRLNEEVVKQCQAAKFELSTAATRAAHLEENLKQRSDALAEEKKLRLQLQGQLNSVDYVKNAVLREVKAGKDAVLDKLLLVHAMLEGADNRQEVTEMLEKTTTAIQGLSSQQASATDDVVSVKGMLESLSESMSRTINDRNSDSEEKFSALQSKIKELEVELQSKTSEVTSLQEKLENTVPATSMTDKDVETIRRDAIAFQAQRHAEMENELKKLRARPGKDELLKLRQKLDETQRQADSRQQDIDILNGQLEREKQALSSAQQLASTRQQELDQLNKQLASQKRDFEHKLGRRPSHEEHASAKEQLSESQRLANARQQEINALNVEVESKKRDLVNAQRLAESRQEELNRLKEQLENDKRAFEKTLGRRPTTEELSSTKEELAEAQKVSNEKEDKVSALTTKLEKEQERYQQLESRFEQYKKSCDANVSEEKDRARNDVDAAKQQLARVEKEKEAKTQEELKFRSDIQESWEAERTRHGEEVALLRQQLEEAQRQAQEANKKAEQQKETQTQTQTLRQESPVVEESQLDPTWPSFAAVRSRKNPPTYVDTQEAPDWVQESIFEDHNSDKENALQRQKPPPVPNSSSKRVAPPKPQSRSSGLSSSPGFMASQSRRKPSTTYGGGSSAQKRRPSHSKEQPKRKADGGHVVDGYEEERRKRIKPTASAPSTNRSQTNKPSTRAVAPPVSSQGSYRGRVTRSKTDEMSARFSQELQTNRGGQTVRR